MRNPNLLYDFWILFRKYYKIFGFWPEIITVNVTGADICLRSRKDKRIIQLNPEGKICLFLTKPRGINAPILTKPRGIIMPILIKPRGIIMPILTKPRGKTEDKYEKGSVFFCGMPHFYA